MADFTYKNLAYNFLAKDVGALNGERTYVLPTTLVDAAGALLGSAANPIFTSAGGSGGSTVVTQPTAANLNAQVIGSVASGAAIPTNPVFIAGSDGTNVQPLKTNSSGNLQITGSVASGVADSGNPLKVGGVYNLALPTFTTGQRGDLQLGSTGMVRAQISVPVSATGTDGITNTSGIGFVTQLTGAGLFTSLLATSNFTFNGTSWDRPRTITGAVADGTGLGVTAVEQAGALFNNITTAATTTVKSGKTILHKLVLNTYVASATITLYDSLSASGTKIGTLTLPSTITGDTPITLPYDLQCTTGLTIVTSGATDITVIYR